MKHSSVANPQHSQSPRGFPLFYNTPFGSGGGSDSPRGLGGSVAFPIRLTVLRLLLPQFLFFFLLSKAYKNLDDP